MVTKKKQAKIASFKEFNLKKRAEKWRKMSLSKSFLSYQHIRLLFLVYLSDQVSKQLLQIYRNFPDLEFAIWNTA